MHEEPHADTTLARARALLLPNCREMCRHSSRALDGALPWWQRPGVTLHLLCCRLCHRYLAQLRWLRRAARLLKTAELPRGRLPEAARVRLKHALLEVVRRTPATGQDAGDPSLIPPP